MAGARISDGDYSIGRGTPHAGVVDIAHTPAFNIAAIKVDPPMRQIAGPVRTVTLEPKVMQALIALTRIPGEIVAREDLVRMCWQQRIVGDNSVNRVISLLRTGLRDAGGDAITLETIPKVGFRLIGTEIDAGQEADQHAEAASDSRSWLYRHRLSAGLTAAAAVVIALLAGWTWLTTAPARPQTVMIAPFTSDDPASKSVARGLADELRSELARAEGLRVARIDAAPGVSPDRLLAAADRLNADYLLEGRVERSGERLLVDTSLREVDGGSTIWTQKLASALTTSYALPRRLARGVVGAMGRETAGLDSAMATNKVDPASYILYLNAQGIIANRNLVEMDRAIEMLRQVTRVSPRFSSGWSALAKGLYLNRASADLDEPGAARSLAETHARKALALDPRNAEAMATLGMVTGNLDERLQWLEKAVDADEQNLDALLWLGNVHAERRELAAAMAAWHRVLMLDPLWERANQISDFAAMAGRVEDADQIDRQIAAAAIEDWQSQRALARIARRQGDWSEYILRSEAAALAGPQDLMINRLLDGWFARAYLGLPVPRLSDDPSWEVTRQLLMGTMPSIAFMQEHGMEPASFWRLETAAIGSRLLVSRGRPEELVAIYDLAFEDTDEFLASVSEPDFLTFSTFAPYLVLALRETGRNREAERILAAARQSIERWLDADIVAADIDMSAAQIFAISGDEGRAMQMLERAAQKGWPDTFTPYHAVMAGQLSDAPAFAGIDSRQRYRELQAMQEKDRARERAEVLAQDRR